MVRLKDCSSVESLVEEMDDMMIKLSGCLLAVSSVEKNWMAANWAEVTMLDWTLTAAETAA
jgi:hypothetical protein